MLAPAKTRVVHYCAGGRTQGGGIGRIVGYIQDEAARVGVAQAVIDTRGPRWNWVGSPCRLAFALAVLAWSRVFAPERIHHVHVAGRGSTARKLVLTAAARTLGCIHLVHLHDYDYGAEIERRSPWVRQMIRMMFQGADLVIVLGQRDRAVVERRLQVPAERIAVIPNAVPDPGPPADRGTGHPGRPITILFLGRLSERKGVPELLSALAKLQMGGLSWRAILAGDGPVEAYREQVGRLGLEGRVTLPGWVDEAKVGELCSAADVLVLPSHAEGLAMSVLEGLSHGLAVVTTRVGAHEEVLADGVTGLFVPVGDVPALARALATLVEDAGLRRRLARDGRWLFEERFSIASYIQRLDEHHHNLHLRRLEMVGVE